MDIKERILVALGLDKPEQEIKLGWQAKSEDGTIFVSTAEELEAGVDVSVLTEDGTTIELPVGTYKTDTGVSFRVEEEGVVGEVMESETEEKETPKEEMGDKKKDKKEDEDEDMRKEEDDYESEAEETDWAKTYEEMKEKVENLEDAIADIKKQIGESGDVEEMAEEVVEPTDKPKTIKTTEVKEFSAEEEITKLKAENEKLKTELSTSPADAPINTNKFSSDRKPLTKKEYNKLSRQERFLYNLGK